MYLAPINNVPDSWQMSDKGQRALQRATEIRSRRHGLYASIPIICRAEECPYACTCELLEGDLAPLGEKCPMEIAAIEQLFDAYVQDLNVETMVDFSLVKELVDIDISILRCDSKLSADADFIQELAIAISNKGHVVTQPSIHKAAEYKDKLVDKRHKILQLLNSTRKDKEGNKLRIEYDPSSRAAELLEKAQEYWEKHEVIDVEPGGE